MDELTSQEIAIFMRRISLFLIFLLFSKICYAETSLWKVSKDGQYLFLGGTIHVLSESDYPLPDDYDRAYSQAQKIVFETDVAKVSEPSFQKKMQALVTYSDGSTLQSALNKATYAKLEKYCAAINLPIATLQDLKPIMVAITLTVMELQRLGMGEEGVDHFYNSRAIRDHKTLGELETAEDQLSFIVNMGKGQENELIEQTISEIKELPVLMNEMKAAWRIR